MTGADLVIRNAVGILTGLRGPGERCRGDIRIHDGRIAEIGAVAARPGDRVLDAAGGVVTPGLVSAHHHLFQSMLKAVPAAIDARLETWLRLVPVRYWHRFDEEALRTAAEVGMAELLLSGCTMVNDHHYPFASFSPAGGSGYDPAAILFETAERMGIRLCLSRGGTTRDRVYDNDDVVPMPVETLDGMLRHVEGLAARYHDSGPNSMRRVLLAPNTPTWGATPAELKEMAAAGRRLGIGLHSHLSETTNYVTFCAETHGCRPVAFVAGCDWVGPDVSFAHLVHIDADEIALLAATGTFMVHCPQSNGRLGSGVAPASALERAGGRVAIGVDGAASNEACDMASEMHNAWLIQRAVGGPGAARVEDVLRWSSASGAAMLGFAELGTVAVGQIADLAIHALDAPRHAGLHDPLLAPVICGPSSVRHVLCAGRPVVVDGAIPGLDLPRLMARARAVVARLMSLAG
ncbi:amidohydrolase family protein [Gluconacetobacter asukensis]|uniref:Amidohydrolase family protein n=1 Tax=Gluconacetobacter asukensis TaxID=1017181 RepID=A0A7W4IXJ7_9PROT|nr:amidohydrolase family protein [Gluconacetobacter asukensis]MBB2170582.1 amidohydrolase family protein [Gluconacetobacter asukensis]